MLLNKMRGKSLELTYDENAINSFAGTKKEIELHVRTSDFQMHKIS